MALSHPQAYLNASEVIAASPPLDAGRLDVPNPGGDALLVVELNGFGRVAARRTGDFTHVVAGENVGIALWNAPFWRAEGSSELEDLPELPHLDLGWALELLADTPYGVREAVLDAALAGPVTLVEEDPERRAAWIAWISAVLPSATFTTFAAHPIDVRVCATTPEHAAAFDAPIDTRTPATTQPSRFAAVATAVAGRDPSALGEERDAVALAVNGGATDLLTPEDLPDALELITALAKRGDIAAAARAAAGLGAAATALVRAAPPPPVQLEVLHEPDPEPVEAEVVEAEAVELVAWPTIEPDPEPVDEIFTWTPDHVDDPIEDAEVIPEPEPEPEPERSLEELMAAFATDPLEAPEVEDEVLEETEVGLSLSELEATLEVEESEVGMSLDEFEASLKRERES